MYPVVRTFIEGALVTRQPKLDLLGTHESTHRCWPWDLDMWMELNNGRTLTLFDLGRLPLAYRVGLVAAMRRRRWGLTMAGAVVRYRRRIRIFQRFTMKSRAIGWDDKFMYIEQSMWVAGQAANHVVYRSAVTDKNGLVPPALVAEEMGIDPTSPELPEWVQNWLAAEQQRPWPPEM